MHIPRLYPILDASCFADAEAIFTAADELATASVTLLQYRNKSGNAREMLDHARELKGRVGDRVTLIMNDRADLCLAADFDGLHVGQDDLSPEAARHIIGPAESMSSRDREKTPVLAGVALQRCDKSNIHNAALAAEVNSCSERKTPRLLGVSTHNPEQLAEADKTTADYLAIGPVFATSSKANPDPVVGLEGVRRARELTSKPIVAIGGITRANARSVIDAGADAVAVISDLIRHPRKSAEEFLAILR
jgi:thiamine-phosphate pyrophosphorylase